MSNSNTGTSSKPLFNSKTQQHAPNPGIVLQRSAKVANKRCNNLKGISRIKFFDTFVNRVNSICNRPSEQYWRIIRRAGTTGAFDILGVNGKPVIMNLVVDKRPVQVRQRNNAAMQRTQQWCSDLRRQIERRSKKKKRLTHRTSKRNEIRKRKSRTSLNEDVKEAYIIEFPETSECTLNEMSSLDSIILPSDFDLDSESIGEIKEVNEWLGGQKYPDIGVENNERNAKTIGDEQSSVYVAASPRRRRRKRPVMAPLKCAFCQGIVGDIAFINGTKQLCGECAEKHFEEVTKSRLQEQSISYKEFKAVSGDTVYTA